MRIKRLELNGFKSFKDRVVIDLGAGVTGIVGPNGCGKSNIVDAIRWVIGEQSPKHLRGDAMEDVIFAGNTDNGPMGMAEVSFLLERDENDLLRDSADANEEGGGLPPVFAGVSEVLVTRRYFRSGESEYFINRAPCRLKDITELFLGTGVGTKAYAIIEQGRIEQLVNAKPQEMRLFIEEAAGVTRFRHRKTAAMRKMERTRDNLLRVQDVLSELERQKSTLERQARRAEEHGRIKTELRDLDLRVMATRHRAVGEEMARLQAEATQLLADEAEIQADLRRLQETISDGREQRAAVEQRRGALDGEITEQRVKASEAHAQINAQSIRATDMVARGAALQREQAELDVRAQRLGEDLERLSIEEEQVADEQETAAIAHAESAARLDMLLIAGPPLESAVEAAKDAVVAVASEQARVRNTLEALHARREEIAGRRLRLEEEQGVLGTRLHAARQTDEEARERLQQLQAELQQKTDARRECDERSKQLAADETVQQAAYEHARTNLTQIESRLRSLRELQSRYEGCTRGVGSILGRQQADVVLLASVLRVPEALERAVAAALGAKLSQVVVPTGTDAVQSVRWLEETNAGSATLVPRDPERRPAVIVPTGRRLIDSVEVAAGYWALAEALLGHVLLADDLEQAVALWREAPHAVVVVTPAGHAVDHVGAVTGGSEPPLEETLLARARELRELEASAEAAQLAVAEHGQRLENTRQALTTAVSAVAQLEQDLQRVRLSILGTEKDRERLEEERVRISAQLEACALDASGLAGSEEQAAVEVEGLADRLALAGSEAEARQSELQHHQGELATWRDQKSAAERQRTAMAVREAAAIERRRAVAGERTRTEAGRVELLQRIEAMIREIAAAEAAAAMAEAARVDAVARATASEALLQTLTSERDTVAERLQTLNASMSEEDRAERQARERIESTREERGRRDLALAERRLVVDHLGAQLAERYELTIDVLEDVASLEAEEQAQGTARVEQLRRRLVQLGDVNPAAVIELEEVRTRYDFLEAQRGDLERSLDDLRKTIARLTRVSRERFDETFAAANEKLEDMFPKLFPGGKAHLELVPLEEGEEGDPGIQIVVQPAGKKLQHLSLLSGGEKAMTATALVLSLFLIRPTPFCLLDEVDAPLDEANIGRFITVVREMAETSQFLLITHNRRTMEMADSLYGITMEQAGVSKIVSVRLREAA